jgi:hypothetical protein
MTAPYVPWSSNPDDLGPFDAVVVRCVAGEMTDEFGAKALGVSEAEVRRRMGVVLKQHFEIQLAELKALEPRRRRRLAEEIIDGTLAERARGHNDNVVDMPDRTVPAKPSLVAVPKTGADEGAPGPDGTDGSEP